MYKRHGMVGSLLLLALIFTPPAKAFTSARCEIQAIDAYGTPAAGIKVILELWNLNAYGYEDAASLVSLTGWTNASGRVTLSWSTYPREFARCYTTGSGYVAYGGGLDLWNESAAADVTLSGTLVVLPKPSSTIQLPAGGTADLYGSGQYDKPVVVAQPFFIDEPVNGRMSADDLWKLYNGDPRLLNGGMLVRLFRGGYDVWLVRPLFVGQDLNLQAINYAQAVARAAGFQSYNSKVSVAGFSMGGLVVRIAMAKWNSYGTFGPMPPVNLIATLDSPLRGALVSNDLQHAFWNAGDDGEKAHENNMDSCAAQQMLENACHKTLWCPYCLECNDRGWYETFYGGNSFTFCNPHLGGCNLASDPYYSQPWGSAGLRTCSGVGLLNLPNGGWPAGIRKIAASLGKLGERTVFCYGDATGLDKKGDGTDGCPAFDAAQLDTGSRWGYLDIRLNTDRELFYRRLNASSHSWRDHWIDELTPGSRQPASVENVAESFLWFRVLNGHQFAHAGTFIPIYSALDIDSMGSIPFDEYWTNEYSAFHDALTERPGAWVNQRDGSSGVLPLVPWLIENLDSAFFATGPPPPPPVPPVCGDGLCESGETRCDCSDDCGIDLCCGDPCCGDPCCGDPCCGGDPYGQCCGYPGYPPCT